MACWIDILSSGRPRGLSGVAGLIGTRAYRQHCRFAGEGILEEYAFLSDRCKFVQRNELEAAAVLRG